MGRASETRRGRCYTEDDLQSAIAEINEKSSSIYAASKKFKIPKSTLRERVQKLSEKEEIGILSTNEEKKLVEKILLRIDTGSPLTNLQIMEIAGEMAEKHSDATLRFKNGTPMSFWMTGFFNRHPEISEHSKKRVENLVARLYKQVPEFDDHLNKCRCCFKTLNNRGNQITDENIRKFFEFVQVELKSSGQYSSKICDICKKQLENIWRFCMKFADDQKRLYKFVEDEPIEEEDIKDNGNEFLKNCDQSLNDVDPEPNPESFELFDLKTVVVKVEPIDFDVVYLEENTQMDVESILAVEKEENTEDEQKPTSVVDANQIQMPDKRESKSAKNLRNVRGKKVHLIQKPSGHKTSQNTAKTKEVAIYKTCSYCGMKLKISSYYPHMKSHKNQMMNIIFKCDLCLYRGKTRKDIKEHMFVHISDESRKVYECRSKFCGEIFVRTNCRSKHEKKYHSLESDGTSENSKKIETVFSSRSYLCSICGFNLKNSHSFYTHMKTHKYVMNNIVFHCDLCSFKGKNRQSIRDHLYTHMSNESKKVYKCKFPSCGKKFLVRSQRYLHQKKAHSTEEPKTFECECGKTFTAKSGLLRHRERVHDNVQFPCSKCDKILYSKTSLQIHNKTHMPKVPCELCGKFFAPGDSLRNHLKSHGGKVRCDFEGCGKLLANKSMLRSHMQSHKPPGSFKCETCNAEFTHEHRLKAHITKQHLIEKKPCPVPNCKHSTQRRVYMTMHINNHKDISGVEKKKFIEGLKKTMKSI